MLDVGKIIALACWIILRFSDFKMYDFVNPVEKLSSYFKLQN